MYLEGKRLSRERTAAIIEKKPVIGLQTRIREITNAVKVYNQMSELNPWSQDSLLSAHYNLMAGIGEEPGLFRTEEMPVFRGKQILHMAPVPEKVPCHMDELFELLNSKKENLIVKSCMAHFKMECIQPFTEASGIMGRLWQTLILMQEYKVFEFLSWEKLVYQTRNEYFRALTNSEKAGRPDEFMLYMLEVIDHALESVPLTIHRNVSVSDRLLFFHELDIQSFARKDYMKVFRNISTSTASRDLEAGVNAGLFEKRGTKNASIYSCL